MKNLEDIFQLVREASRKLPLLPEAKINKVLDDLAMAAIKYTPEILDANQEDLDRMDPSDPKFDRLKLTEERLENIAEDIINVAKLDSPLGTVLAEKRLPNGLELKKVRVPIGVIGIIYESRPNVTFDVFSLCLKTGNALILKGGSDAYASNAQIVEIIHKVLTKNKVDPNMVHLLPAGREATKGLLEAVGFVDVIIPRGSQGLIDFVRENAKVPVIETGAGIVHTYFDSSADLEKGTQIICNAKTRRVSVCNALDCLLIHENRLSDLKTICAPLAEKEVKIFADQKAHEALKGNYPGALLHIADEGHFGTEFLSLTMSVKTVAGMEEALSHISKYSSKHSEAILATDEKRIDLFLQSVDAAAVYANASTAFTDGAQFGLGAEIGISTQKLHARGPMALEEMCSYKWQIRGQGQIRP
ncbi:glutamate-5-semialdehyde dehydrogenase [Cyclobacterium lianum]|uniref:Gamma-glutamyl phosphate reductase n=1 Tax=Cyclobacterium lianum TaxID=388280 RepID=A0A1M7P9A0_9BACT|nr:glutamate-5-semialdehyde dehydrogenase [Cyclobacterium lianum]SHN13256.1 glutamate-5-semialdehyde dehydrogenase [Cyclobacterium lianum]